MLIVSQEPVQVLGELDHRHDVAGRYESLLREARHNADMWKEKYLSASKDQPSKVGYTPAPNSQETSQLRNQINSLTEQVRRLEGEKQRLETERQRLQNDSRGTATSTVSF